MRWLFVIVNVESLCFYLYLMYEDGSFLCVYVDSIVFFNIKRVLVVGDLVHAWCVSFWRLRDLLYFVSIYLVGP